MTDGRQWVLGRVDYQRVALRHGVLPTTVKMSTGVDARVGRNRYLRAHTHTHPFNGPFSRTTRVHWCQKGKTNLLYTEARDSEWQWHQLGHMQVCTSLQTDYHASTPPLCFYRPDALPAAQPTVSKH